VQIKGDSSCKIEKDSCSKRSGGVRFKKHLPFLKNINSKKCLELEAYSRERALVSSGEGKVHLSKIFRLLD
jgi:hypothetical protein